MGLSPSTSPTSSLIDFVDSHYNYVATRMAQINPSRQFGPMVKAADWPTSEAQENTFYLITGPLEPVNSGRGPGSNSWFSPLYSEIFQWGWIVVGTDIAPSSQSGNRADRYRTHYQMMQEMLQAMYPGFCEKQQFSLQGTTTPQLVATSYIPAEYIWWKKPRFTDSQDRSTGIIFGYAVSSFSGFAPEINY